MKKPVSKDDIRQELEKEIDDFLLQGGKVENVPSGVSGKDPDEPPLYLNRRLFVEPPTTRTQIPEVIAAIDARKQKPRRNSGPVRGRTAAPRRKIIYDDFGEPLRKVWIED